MNESSVDHVMSTGAVSTSALEGPSTLASRPAGSARRPQNVGDTERLISALGGSVLVLAGLSRGKLGGLLLASLGGALVHRGWTGHCHGYEAFGIDTAQHNPATAVPARQGVKLEKSIAVNRSPSELYAFWRNVENLPRVMRHLRRVEAIDRDRSRWAAKGPLGSTVQWQAEVIGDREPELIAWRSLPDSQVDTAGSVHFTPLSHDRGTAVAVSLKYNPPAGKVGDAVASLLGSGLEQELEEDLRRFKSMMEAGEVPTS
jgi:uncharacterized membrane protein